MQPEHRRMQSDAVGVGSLQHPRSLPLLGHLRQTGPETCQGQLPSTTRRRKANMIRIFFTHIRCKPHEPPNVSDTIGRKGLTTKSCKGHCAVRQTILSHNGTTTAEGFTRFARGSCEDWSAMVKQATIMRSLWQHSLLAVNPLSALNPRPKDLRWRKPLTAGHTMP